MRIEKKKMNRKKIEERKSLNLFLQAEFLLFCVASSVCKIDRKLISSPFSCQSAKASKNIHDILCIYGTGIKEKSKCSEPITSEFQTVLFILFPDNFKFVQFVELCLFRDTAPSL
jgi:hypothetical protein